MRFLSVALTSRKGRPVSSPAVLFALLLLFLLCLQSPAQLSTATVTGIIHDSTGGVVGGAKITLRNLDTTVEIRAESNSSGNYVFLNITPGRYSLEATSTGFQTSKVPELALAVNQTVTVDLTLQVGTM